MNKEIIVAGVIITKTCYIPKCLCGNEFYTATAGNKYALDRKTAAEVASACGWNIRKAGEMYTVECPECMVKNNHKHKPLYCTECGGTGEKLNCKTCPKINDEDCQLDCPLFQNTPCEACKGTGLKE